MNQQLASALVLCVVAQLTTGQQDCSAEISLSYSDGHPILGQMDSGCRDFTWTISAEMGEPFALILSNILLATGENLTFSSYEDGSETDNLLQCNSNGCNSGRRAFIIQPDHNFVGQAKIRLVANSAGNKVYFSAMAATIDPLGNGERHGDGGRCGMPAWATVAVVFFVFFFLTIMCVVTVHKCRCCCKKYRTAHIDCPHFAHQHATVTVPVANLPAYNTTIPPPAYKSNPTV
uniref:Uncharacterized protein n=1 Tax=Plectus sambesii TaxID=2011161 RepID=A0A914X2A7_9BILA